MTKTKKMPAKAKTVTISEQDLDIVKKIKTSYDDNQFILGGLLVKEKGILNEMERLSAQFSDKMNNIGEQYGKGSLDMETGTITLEK